VGVSRDCPKLVPDLRTTSLCEILFVARGIRGSRAVLPPPLPGIARVDSIKALGVVVNNRLSAADHVDSAIAACAKSL